MLSNLLSLLVLTVCFINPNDALAQAETASISLSWNANPASENISHYTIHWGTASRNYSNSLNVGNVTKAKITGLLKTETYHFALTAHNSAGSSGFSEEVQSKFKEDPPPPKPIPYKIDASTFKVGSQGEVEMVVNGVPGGYCILETSYDLTNWHQLDELVFDTDEAIKVMIQPPANKKPAEKQFFRIKWESE